MRGNLIAITGANGEIGRRVSARIAERGQAHRLLVRNPAGAPRHPAAEVKTFAGYGDRESMGAALDGVSTLLLVSGHESEGRVAEHLTALDAAADAGVAHIVYLSFLGASPYATFTLARDHHVTEEAIRERGFAFTFLRDSLYLDVLPAMVGTDGSLRGPAGDGRLAGVARDDVADAAAAALLDPGHVGQTYDLVGPEALTLAEIAGVISAASGRRIGFIDETIAEAYASRAGYGASGFLVDAWVSTYLAVKAGEFDVQSGAVRRLTGRDPIGLRTVLERMPGCLGHLGVPAPAG
jgi:uncharacterized protein YbjT (DUF2867 family)